MSVLLSVLLSFVGWFLLSYASFLGVGLGGGWLVGRLLPAGQRRLPRRWWMVLCGVVAGMVGFSPSVQVGAIRASIALGDGLVPGVTAGVRIEAMDLREGLEEEVAVVRRTGMLLYVGSHVTGIPVIETIEVGTSLLDAIRAAQGENEGGRKVEAFWAGARPGLVGLAKRKVAVAMILGLATLVGLLGLGGIGLLLVWKEVRR